MNDKFVAKSMTVWGGLVAALPGIFLMFGWDIDIGNLQAAGVAVIQGVSIIGGLVMVVIGRIRANNGTPVRLKLKL